MHHKLVSSVVTRIKLHLCSLTGQARGVSRLPSAVSKRSRQGYRWPGLMVAVVAAVAQCSARAGTPTPRPTLGMNEIAQWIATDQYVCTFYADGVIICWDLRDGKVAGRAVIPRKLGGPFQGAIAIGRDESKLACSYIPPAADFPGWTLRIFALPALSTTDVYSLGTPLDGFWEMLTELDCTDGKISYEGHAQYIAGARDLKNGRLIWEFRNPVGITTRPVFPPPVFVAPGWAGYIAVIAGKATAHNPQGKILWSRTLPRPADFWNSPDLLHGFGRCFVVQDRDDSTGPIAAFDRQDGTPRWQSFVADSGNILATNDSGERQVFLKDGTYSLLCLPKTGRVVCELSGDQDVRFSPNGKFLTALPSLQIKAAGGPAPGAAFLRRPSSTLRVVDAENGKLLNKIELAEPD